jgi:predicted RNA-binding protein with PIN domain
MFYNLYFDILKYMQGNHTSKKPAVYLIDGLNFIRSFLSRSSNYDEETLTAELIDWLDELGQTKLLGSDFRLILDGSYRNVGATKTAYVSAHFTEELSADEIILEQAEYLRSSGQRVIVVSSDLVLNAKIRELGVKTIGCSKFFNDFFH